MGNRAFIETHTKNGTSPLSFYYFWAIMLYLVIPCYTCPASRFVMSLAVGMQGQKAYGLCTTPPPPMCCISDAICPLKEFTVVHDTASSECLNCHSTVYSHESFLAAATMKLYPAITHIVIVQRFIRTASSWYVLTLTAYMPQGRLAQCSILQVYHYTRGLLTHTC